MPTNEFQALRAKLDAARGQALKQAERKALKAVGSLVQGEIKRRAPFQAGEQSGGILKPGELAADVQVHVSVASDQATAQGNTSRVSIGPGEKTRAVANWVENGHAGRGSAKREGPARFVPAHPYTRPAFDAVQEEATELYESVMTEEMTKALR